MTDDELIAALLNAYEKERYYLAPGLRMRAVLDMVRLHDARHRPPEPNKPKRVPVQIAVSEGPDWSTTRVIADDGTMWEIDHGAFTWRRLPDLRQD